MHRRTLLTLPLTAAGAAIAATPAHAENPGRGARPLTVMTFNIHHGAGTDEVLDLERIAQVIRGARADVIGLQEVDRHYSERSELADQPAELARMLGMQEVFGANIDDEPPSHGAERIQYGTAILSRYPVTASENISLSGSPGQERRGLLRATIDVRGVDLVFCSTHLAASSQTDRLVQAQEIIDLVGREDPVIVVGDVNALPGSPEVEILQDAFTDAWSQSGEGDGSTYPAEDADGRIDALYLGGSVRSLRTVVVRTSPEASDHLPVVSRVLLEP